VATPPPCATCYLTADHLGSTRMVTDASGTVQSLTDYLPFGEEIQSGVGLRAAPYYPLDALAVADGVTQKFTGKERDVETGNDYFGARYLSSAQGRFTSPDWSAQVGPVPYAKLDNPQSLNLYSYVLNNPLTSFDDDGHEIVFASGLKNPQLVKDTVKAILADPHTSGNLSGYVGPNNPNLVIQSGDLSSMDSATQSPDGTPGTTITQGLTVPDIQTTRSSSTDSNGVTTTSAPETTLTGTTITIDNRTSAGDTPGVMVHESVHAGEAKANPAQYSKDNAAEKSLFHDKRPQEKRAIGAQKAYGAEIKKAVKQMENDRKKEGE
jgi:RHS repeat-associated protein